MPAVGSSAQPAAAIGVHDSTGCKTAAGAWDQGAARMSTSESFSATFTAATTNVGPPLVVETFKPDSIWPVSGRASHSPAADQGQPEVMQMRMGSLEMCYMSVAPSAVFRRSMLRAGRPIRRWTAAAAWQGCCDRNASQPSTTRLLACWSHGTSADGAYMLACRVSGVGPLKSCSNTLLREQGLLQRSLLGA